MGLSESSWLSGMLGKPAYGLDDSRIAETVLPAAPAFIEAKVDVAHADRVAALTARGFHLITVNVQLKRPAGRGPLPAAGAATVRAARAADRDAVTGIAGRSFTLDRFHADPAIAPAIADRIKAEWAANFFAGTRGDLMAVAEVEGRVAGFNLLLRRDGALIIDLIAVAPGQQRRGLGGALIAYAAEQWAGDAEMIVGTQLTNRSSLGLYERFGFRLESAAYVLHHHGVPA